MQRFTEYLGDFVAYRRFWAWGLVVVVTVASVFGLAGYRLFDFKRRSEPLTKELTSLIKAHGTFRFGDFRYVVVVEHEELFDVAHRCVDHVLGRDPRDSFAERFVRDLTWSLALAAGVIFVVLSVAYRSIRIGLISVIPNLLPLAATATIRAMWDTSLDIASACALVICLGIAVDDTIHFLTRFRHERETGLDIAASIRRTYATVGNALVMTTVVMMAGFGTVLTSQLPTHRSFAAMGCITLGVALLADLIILPSLLLCFFRDGEALEQERD
ncbi:MAG TPA: efflux RND transporter permease subunit [Thermoguttaceae bacterium]|nr:efflux RND transporter permease subunit [Thermoguttaceae bacterium]